MTLLLTRHMLKFGDFCEVAVSVGQYQISEIKNEWLSNLAGSYFSRLAMNPQFYVKAVLQDYKYHILAGVLVAGGVSRWKGGKQVRAKM